MIDSVDEAVLDNMNESELREYLDLLFDQALTVVKDSTDWPFVRQDNNVTTRRKRLTKSKQDHLDQQPRPATTSKHCYIQRQSEHNDITYDQIRKILLENHSLNEPKYVALLEDVNQLKVYLTKERENENENKVSTEAGLYRLGYKASVVSPREFIELVATREFKSSPLRSFLVVSQPLDTSNYHKESHVRGKYVSWEYICEKYVDDDDEQQGGRKIIVEWVCVQQSSAGGWIPAFLSDWVAAKDFHKDVNSLIDYIKTHK